MNCINHPATEAVGMCIACGKPICSICKVDSGGEIYCKECIAKKASASEKKQKSPALASILSMLLGGLGQLYNGQPGKGILIFITSWLIIPWIYGIFDAYKTAERINSGEIVIPKRTGCVVAALAFMVLTPIAICIIAILAAIAIPAFITANEDASASICRNNLLIIEQSKQLYAGENNLTQGDAIPADDNNGIYDNDGIPDVLEKDFKNGTLYCPKGGRYTIGLIGEPPQCSIGKNKNKKTEDDHILILYGK